MSLLVGRGAPNFNAVAFMPDGTINPEFNLAEYIKDRMAVVFFYSMDFSHVCTTELVSLNNRYSELQKNDIALVCISGDSQLTHKRWQSIAPFQGGVGKLRFPLIADISHKIAAGYEVLVNESLSLRATFIIDKIGIVRHQSVNDFPIGRNIDEVLRIIDGQNFHEKTGKLCPANWQPGEQGLVADDQALIQFMEKNAAML